MLSFASCVQHTLDPTQPNNRLVRIQTITASGNPVSNVNVTLRDDQTAGAAIDYQGNTGDTGAVSFQLAIPTFGHDYALDVKKSDATGNLFFDRPIYPLELKCTDTVITIVVPVPDTTTKFDSLCGIDDERTFEFFVCADTTDVQTYILTNCGNTPYTVSFPKPPLPFIITPNVPTTIAPHASLAFQITYDARGQTTNSSEQVTITTTPPSGSAVLTLIGHPLHNCSATSQFIVCDANSTTDSVRFGTICKSMTAGPICVPFANSSNSPVTVTMPAEPARFSYTATDKNGVSVKVPGGTLTLQQGDQMTVCIGITPSSVGQQFANLVFPMQCAGNGGSFTYAVPISATVKVCDTCQCSSYFHDPVTFSENTPVGSDTMFTTEIFHNDLNCQVTISNVTDDGSPWTIISFTPSLPAIVPASGSISVQMRFSPLKAGKATDHLKFQITPQGASTPCSGEIDLDGLGCHDACAAVAMPPEWKNPNGPDSLYFKQGSNPKITVSTSTNQSQSDQECIMLTYPDTGCGPKAFSVLPPKDAKFSVTTTPSPLVLSPTVTTGQVCVTFAAPQIAQVRQTFTIAGQELKYTDLLQIIDPTGCAQNVPLKAVVDTLPSCHTFNLPEWDFQGLQNVVYYDVYSFDHASNLSNGPPLATTTGDIYLSAGPPAYTMSAVDGSSRFFFWKNDPTTPLCSDIPAVTSGFGALNLNGLTPSLKLNVFDWIVVLVHPGVYAVIQITTLYTDGDNIPHVDCQYLYPFYQ